MPQLNVEQAFFLAQQHHQAGRLQEAEQLYRQILAQQPQYADALHLLGVLAHQMGRNALAIDMIRQASVLQPNSPEVYYNLGTALMCTEHLDDAIAAFRRAILLRPHFPQACYNLGNALRDKGRLNDSVAAYRQAIALQPNNPEAYGNLCNVLQGQGNLTEAIAAGQQAIALKPDLPELHNNLATAWRAQGQIDESIAACRRAIALEPGYPEAYNNLGVALAAKGLVDEALSAYHQAINLKAHYPEAYNNLGTALEGLGRLDEARAACLEAIALKPQYPEAHNNLGNVLARQGRMDEALAAYRQAIALRPNYPEAYNNLGNTLKDQEHPDMAISAYRQAIVLRPDYPEAHRNLGNALYDKGQLDAAISAYRQANALKPNFADAYNNLGNALKDNGQLDEAIAACQQAITLNPRAAGVHSNLVFCLYYHPDTRGASIHEASQRWEKVHASSLAGSVLPCGNNRTLDRPLRIGYVSADLRKHSVAYFLLPLLEAHDKNRCHITCYAASTKTDAVTERLRACADAWRSLIGRSDEQAEQLIREDRIDILVDLSGHTAGNRLLLFARKPAPVQVTWLGFPGTTGLHTIDYRLTDVHADPIGTTEQFYSEKLIRLPEIFACFRPDEAAPPVGPLPALARGHITFGSFHSLAKVNAEVLNAWARILSETPGSHLLMVVPDPESAACRRRFHDYFAPRGIAPERLEFQGRLALEKYLESHNQVDIMLDTHPFSGHTISCHALWMGVPIITLAGHLHHSRMVTSVLRNVGLSELIAQTPDEYVQATVALAKDLPRLANLRSTLRDHMKQSPLVDAPRFARNIEAAYREMWRTWCRSNLPQQ